jgi:hypothetical protein
MTKAMARQMMAKGVFIFNAVDWILRPSFFTKMKEMQRMMLANQIYETLSFGILPAFAFCQSSTHNPVGLKIKAGIT